MHTLPLSALQQQKLTHMLFLRLNQLKFVLKIKKMSCCYMDTKIVLR